MKKTLLSLFSCAVLLISNAQEMPLLHKNVQPHLVAGKTVPVLTLQAPDLNQLAIEDADRDKNGQFYRIGIAMYTNATPQNSGSWTTLPNGDRQWQLVVKSSGAEALSLLFDAFRIYDGTTFNVSDKNGKLLQNTWTKNDVLEHGMQHAALLYSDEVTLTLVEPVGAQPSEIFMDRVMYGYRSTGRPTQLKDFGDSESCEINVNCSPVGDNWQDEKRGVARILVVEGSSQGWCTGSLVNNTAQDCKPLFLTALHCGPNATTNNFNQWRFYFRFEATGCTSPGSAGTLDDNFITGCVKMASSLDGGGTNGSDFLLVQLGTLANQTTTVTTLKSAAFNAYWNGWNANTAATTGGVGIHHPAGDIKKISTFNGTTTSTLWQGSTAGTHWQMSWSSNSNGHGVTEGGSSGSPLFNNSGLIVGTLTGGSSYCTALTSPDVYGKMSFHWTSNGTTAAEQLKTYLDPGNTGALTLTGSADPCSAPAAPVANFVANQTNVTPGTTVNFTDLSSGTPTSWAWAVSPASGWAYAGGTSATSQNPQITFNTIGSYTITLTATNLQGSDQEIKNAYIVVAASTGPCTATTTTCDEYISNVTVGTINNTTTCNNYTSYSQTVTMQKGSAQTITMATAIIGQTTTAYVDDQLAVWIDYNDDDDFMDAGEQIGISTATASAFNTTFNFTVPASAVTGTVKMRVRLHYSGTDVGEGQISPCGSATYGEVEDYNVNITASTSGLEESALFENVSIYPNPTNSILNIDLTSVDASDVTVELYDLSGKQLKSITNEGQGIVSFDVSDLANGMYQVKLTANNSQVTKRISKL